MTKTVFIITTLLMAALSGSAQYSDVIRTDRPGQAINPYSAGRHVLQFQPGVEYGGSGEGASASNYYSGNAVLRYGINRHWELNTGWEWRRDAMGKGAGQEVTSGLSLATAGVRLNVAAGDEYVPAIGFQLSLKLPVLSPAYDFEGVSPQFLMVASQGIGRFSATVNAGASYNGNNTGAKGVYAVNIGYAISDKWSVFAENYGDVEDGDADTYFDGGVAYLVHNDLQLDAYGGWGKNDMNTSYFVSAGVSYRLLTRKN